MKRNWKKIVAYVVLGMVFLAIALIFAMRIWIGHSVRENISIAKSQYPGTAEDALIAFMLDKGHSPFERSHTAVWTLGKLRSEKALPYLNEMYTKDPEGLTCKGRHDEVLCQYELHKAIVNIEQGWFGAREKNRLASWSAIKSK